MTKVVDQDTVAAAKAKALADGGITVHQRTVEDVVFDIEAISDLLIALGCGDTDVERKALYWLGRNLREVGELLSDELKNGLSVGRAAR